MHQFIDIFLSISEQMGYGGIIFLMTIESSFIPFPSEIIIPPAAYLASRGELNIFLVVFSGILGSVFGAVINYFLAMYFGRAVIYSLTEKKIAKFVLIDSKKIQKAEEYFIKYGSLSTFFGRLITVIRQLISIPAGFSKMNFWKFLFYTTLGSGVWVIILALLGYYFGESKEILSMYYHEISIIAIILITVFLAVFIYKRKNKSKSSV